MEALGFFSFMDQELPYSTPEQEKLWLLERFQNSRSGEFREYARWQLEDKFGLDLNGLEAQAVHDNYKFTPDHRVIPVKR